MALDTFIIRLLRSMRKTLTLVLAPFLFWSLNGLAQEKSFSVGLHFPIPTGINNGVYLEPSFVGKPSNFDWEQYSYGTLLPGISLEYRGFTVNFYTVFDYGGRINKDADRISKGSFSPTGASTNAPSNFGMQYLRLEDPFAMQWRSYAFEYNIGYQYAFKNPLDPDAPAAVIGAYLGIWNLEFAAGLEFKGWRLMLSGFRSSSIGSHFGLKTQVIL